MALCCGAVCRSLQPRCFACREVVKWPHACVCMRRCGVLCRSLQPRCFASGEVVIRQGAPSDGMYILLDGQVGIYQRPLGACVCGCGCACVLLCLCVYVWGWGVDVGGSRVIRQAFGHLPEVPGCMCTCMCANV